MIPDSTDLENVYPTLNPYFTPVEISPNEIHFRAGPWSGPIYDIRDEDADGYLTEIVSLLDGNHSLEEIRQRLSDVNESDLVVILAELYERRIIYLRESRRRDETSLRDYASLHPRLTTEGVERLQSQSVLLLQSGDLGRYIAKDLAELGIGRVGVSGERVDSESGSDSIERIRSTEWSTIIPEFDFVIYLDDSPNSTSLQEVNEITHEAGIPWTSGRMIGFDCLIGPTIFPGETNCYECFTKRAGATIPQLERYMMYADQAMDPNCFRLAAFDHLISGFIEYEAIHVLSRGFGFSVGNVIHIDATTMTLESNQVLKLPRCSVCGTSHKGDVNRLTSLDRIVADRERE